MNPFLTSTASTLVAVCGRRGGYVQLAPAQEITQYRALPEELFLAARDWAARLEDLGAQRVYWITLSEVVRHLHIHLYPRWSEEETKGLALFEQRESLPQPEWQPETLAALDDWRRKFSVHLIRSPGAG